MRMINGKGKTMFIQLVISLCIFVFSLSVSQAVVTLTVGDGSGFPGSTDNPVAVSLANPDDIVKAVQMDICDVGNFLTPVRNDNPPEYDGCELTDRTAGFDCLVNELPNGCCRVLLFSDGGTLIEEGEGPVFTLKYDVSGGAPSGQCRNLNPVGVVISAENNLPFEATSVAGEFCFDGSGTTTTTTTVPTTTTAPVSTTTTTATTPAYAVSISPSSATIDSGATLQFIARTTYGGEEVEGTYSWEIVSGSTIGSTIDDDGLFAAGENTADDEIEEMVKVTDTAHEDKSATATVTIQVNEPPPPGCEVAINPSSATVASGDTLTLSASTKGEECEPGDYEWSVDTDIGSVVDQEGKYTAGMNNTGSQADDVIMVVDHANADISGSATITVESEGTGKHASILPANLLGLRWIPLSYVLLIVGDDTNFNLRSTVSFDPGEDIVKLFHIGFGKMMLAVIILRANPQDGTVTVTINTDGEIATGELTIKVLSLPLDDGG